MRTAIANLDSASTCSTPARCAMLETFAQAKRKPATEEYTDFLNAVPMEIARQAVTR